MTSDRSHLVAGIGRRPFFVLGLLVAAALVVLTRFRGVPVATLPGQRSFPATATDGSTPYLLRRATDPHRSPRRPRAPEAA
jgi:hypothetical protein